MYYADFDDTTGLWCVFNDDDDSGGVYAYSSWCDPESAGGVASRLNTARVPS